METYNPQKFMAGLVQMNRSLIRNYFRNFSGYAYDTRDIFLTFTHFLTKLAINPGELLKVQGLYLAYLGKQAELWHTAWQPGYGESAGEDNSEKAADKRFTHEAWDKYPYFRFLKENYLLFEQLAAGIREAADLSGRQRKKLYFYLQQYIDLLSPSNFLFTNPEALELAAATQGNSLWNGFMNFVKDLDKGKITQTDDSAFAVGRNLAISPGTVILENDLIQLIQFTPSTESVHEVPLLIIPPWINKYYILDLQPQNSFVKFMVDQGFTAFIISWKNPRRGDHFSFDDYVEKGALAAAEAASAVTGSEKINALGYCLGGTLLAIAASVAAVRNKPMFNTVTFLAAMVDFSDIGPMGYAIDNALVSKLERGELKHDGFLHGFDMERAFNLIRANELIWNYAVNNYLKGKQPGPFDVLYWTNDNTNLPADMYIFYMRQMILGNRLSRKNALHLCGTAIDVSQINIPAFVIGFREDYISPPATVFTTTELVSGPVEYMLGESGHVMGVVNPPGKKKYGHYTGGQLGRGLEEWKRTAEFVEGSWWISWSRKLKALSGKEIAAPPRAGNEAYRPLEPAPGKYVMQKCIGYGNNTVFSPL